MLVCFACIVAQLPYQRQSFLDVVRHVNVLNECLPQDDDTIHANVILSVNDKQQVLTVTLFRTLGWLGAYPSMFA